MTKDERFLIEIYRQIQASGDKEASVDPKQIAKMLGYKEILTHEILRGLSKANFIKMPDPDAVVLTKRGEELAQMLLKN